MQKQQQRSFSWLLLTAFLVCLLLPVPVWAAPAKNVILLMTDGTSSAHLTLARWYKGAPLALDDILVGGLRTYSAESLITDSAPAATAFATGHKTNTKFLGILPEKTTMPGVPAIAEADQLKPTATVLEGARLMGKSVGLVATSQIQHASPAAFSAHTPFRDRYPLIAQQQVYGNIDVVFGGGLQYLLPKERGGVRTDGQDLTEILKANGVPLLRNRDELLAFNGSRAWGLFAPDALAYDFDRKDFAPAEPSLAEMTRAAIGALSKNEKGFFLFVEASKVDWAAHDNDPTGVVSDLLAYDEAVRAALDFARRDGQTLVMAFADHGTGGMAIGRKEIYKIYDKLPFDHVLGPLKQVVYTGEGMARLIAGNRSEFNIRIQMMQNFAVNDLTDEEVAAIQKAKLKRGLSPVIGPMFSKRAGIGWIYTGHTGEDLFLYAYGPNKPAGLIQNTDIAKITAQSLGFDLAETSRKLFVDAAVAFAAIGATTRLDATEPDAPALIVEKGLRRAMLPLNANRLQTGKVSHALPGLVVQVPKTGQVFVPQKAVELLKEAGW